MKKYNDIFHSISHYFILFIHDQICEEIISFKFVYILWNEWNRNFWLMYAIRMSLPSTVLQRAPNFSLNPNFRNFFFSWVRSPLRRVRRCERAFADPAISKSISGVKVCRLVILFRVVVFAEDVVRFVEAERVLRCGASSVCAAASSSSPPKQSPPRHLNLFAGLEEKVAFCRYLQRLSGYASSELEVSGPRTECDRVISVTPLSQD